MKSLELIVKILDKKQAEDIRVIDIREISTISDYFVIANSKNIQHLNALADEVCLEMANAGYRDKKVEGNYTSGWVLIDFGDLILHIFDKENRIFYNLERMWKDGKELDTSTIIGGEDESKN